jgi:ABC-type Fe3+-siderophore transport system permease subunit
VGVITALIGTPVFLYVLRQFRRHESPAGPPLP